MIHVGDARELMSKADGFESIITDPIWPNHKKVFDCDSSHELFKGNK